MGAIAGGALGSQLAESTEQLAELHKGLGGAVMALASLQVSAILLRPNKVRAPVSAQYGGA